MAEKQFIFFPLIHAELTQMPRVFPSAELYLEFIYVGPYLGMHNCTCA